MLRSAIVLCVGVAAFVASAVMATQPDGRGFAGARVECATGFRAVATEAGPRSMIVRCVEDLRTPTPIVVPTRGPTRTP